MAETKHADERITYIGRRTGRNDKLLHYYKWEGEDMAFSKALTPATVGAVLLADITEDTAAGTRSVGNVRYTGDRTVGEDMTRYAALDAAAVGANEARKAATKHDPLMEALGPIRDAYMAATPIERAALLTNVVRRITTYG